MDQDVLCGVLYASVTVAGIVLAAWLVASWNRRRRVARRQEGDKPSREAPAWLWLLLVGVFGFLIYSLQASREVPLPPPPPDSPRPAGYWLWVAGAGVIAALLTGGSLLFSVLTRLGRRSRGAAVLAVVLAFGASLAVIPTAFGPSPALSLAIIAGGALGYFAGFRWLKARSQDREVQQIAKQAVETGDLDRAVAELRALIDAKGLSAHRIDALGHLFLKKQAWDDAHRAFLEVESLEGRWAYILSNQALALIKGGRAEEALPLLQEALREDPRHIKYLCNYGNALVELGRPDEAGEYLRRAEKERAKLPSYHLKAELDVLDEILGRLRRRVGSADGVEKKDLTGLDEL